MGINAAVLDRIFLPRKIEAEIPQTARRAVEELERITRFLRVRHVRPDRLEKIKRQCPDNCRKNLA
jgi:hypothetical protein